jgi:hypothetical protein
VSFDTTLPNQGVALEKGGNLATIAQVLTYMQVLVDLNTKMLAVLTALRIQQATAYGVSVEPSMVAEDQTFN